MKTEIPPCASVQRNAGWVNFKLEFPKEVNKSGRLCLFVLPKLSSPFKKQCETSPATLGHLS